MSELSLITANLQRSYSLVVNNIVNDILIYTTSTQCHPQLLGVFKNSTGFQNEIMQIVLSMSMIRSFCNKMNEVFISLQQLKLLSSSTHGLLIESVVKLTTFLGNFKFVNRH